MTDKTVIAHGLNLTALPDGNMAALDAMLQRYVEVGCSHVEVTARRLDMIVGGRIVEERAEAVAELLDKHDIGAVLHANHALNFMDLPNLEMHRAVAEASIELARRMSFRSIVIHAGRVPADVWLMSRQSLLATERDELERLGDMAAEAGTQLAVENLIAQPKGGTTVYCADPRALREQIEAIDHPAVGACLDFGHAFISAPVMGFDFVDAIADFSEVVWHLHLHDNCGIPDTGAQGDTGDKVAFGAGDLHMPMGWGFIPWDEVLPRMRFRQGTYGMIELQGRYRAVEQMVSDTAKAFGDYWNGNATLEQVLPGAAAVKEAAE